MSEFDTVLFDLGGVLVSDPWESLLLTPELGLADRLGLDRYLVEQVGKELWERYCLRITHEDDYWSDLSAALNIGLPQQLVGQLEAELLIANAHANAMLDAMREGGITIGVVSEATSFWYPKQVSIANLDRYLEHAREFLSFRFGVGKEEANRGLFEIAAEAVEPRRTLVIDDRPRNLERASSVGFEGFEYSLGSDPYVIERLMEKVMA
jgi:beta-phosphoglucomutase-like phosphatase (HAD superfamily)